MAPVLAYRPGEVPRIVQLIGFVSGGAPRHGLVHLLSKSAARLGFRWNEGSWRMRWAWTSGPFSAC